MKKAIVASALATGLSLLAAPAFAALTTSLPVGEQLWVMPVRTDGPTGPGDIRELDPATGAVTDVFVDSTVDSTSWIVGADYDEATASVYWIRNFGREDQSIVRYNVTTGVETIFDIDHPNDYDIRGIDATEGVIRVSLNLDSNGANAVATVALDEDTLSASMTDVRDLGTIDEEAWQSAIATDPTSGDLYLLTYSCALYRVNDDDSTTRIDFLDNYLSITEDCVTLDFDSNGRAWATTNYTGHTTSFVPSDVSGTIETSDWESPGDALYGEVLFIAPANLPAAEDSLASTGIDVANVLIAGFGLTAVGTFVAMRRRVA